MNIKNKEKINEDYKNLDANDFIIKNITGDGNCFYRTISYYYRDNEEENKDFRNLITEYIENNKDIFYDFITEQDEIEIIKKEMNI